MEYDENTFADDGTVKGVVELPSIDDSSEKSRKLHKIRESYDDIIKRLLHERQVANIPQKWIADQCCVSTSNISAIERGLNIPSAITFLAYINALGFSIIGSDPNASHGLPPELYRKIKLLSPEQQDKLLTIINAAFF